ncbi:recombinase family protein [Xinfangfangia sp. CPCC 101601]|uniref:Recombinase family protein n=1 Tax=Pseudogemmobacter lacusdianii TaxID=3069608 RepID=A0ABU0W455_9RHOB|nr:recombinase family protein [Xinfangfangia sp. CPCC 101601]MDQ2068245.1 recombinase family protein [Xinfangfangia sp. CPCC 101601]
MVAAIYARYSSERQSDFSIEDQVRLCDERAKGEGHSVLETYADRATSGASMLRPGLQALLADALAGRFTVVIAEALDRLSRDQADVATIYKKLAFAGVKILTLSEGWIEELHVGLKGTMNQLFLKDLAAKTRRGLRGRVEAGFSGGGNAYGYRVVRRLDSDGDLSTGERDINEDEALIVRRIYADFACGQSPKAIARKLNQDQIPGPRGLLWRDTAIRGHRQRGTGILNNELYLGRLVWNRLRYVRDPSSGNRVSRPNDPSEWIITDVPQLRIIDDALWAQVKARQEALDATPAVMGIKASRFWEHRRPGHLLTGLVYCDCCGARMASVGRDYLACSAARKLGTCSARKGIRRSLLEEVVLDLLKTRLMQPDSVASFVREHSKLSNSQAAETQQKRSKLETERAAIKRKLEGLYDAISDGLRSPGLRDKLLELEARVAMIDQDVAQPAPPPIRLNPNLSELYHKKVVELANTLAHPATAVAARDVIRGLIDRIAVRWGEDGQPVVMLDGALTALIGLAQDAKSPAIARPFGGSVKVVAGAGFEPATFRL